MDPASSSLKMTENYCRKTAWFYLLEVSNWWWFVRYTLHNAVINFHNYGGTSLIHCLVFTFSNSQFEPHLSSQSLLPKGSQLPVPITLACVSCSITKTARRTVRKSFILWCAVLINNRGKTDIGYIFNYLLSTFHRMCTIWTSSHGLSRICQ